MIKRLGFVGLLGFAACSAAIAFAPGCGSDDDDSSSATKDASAGDSSVTGASDSGGSMLGMGDASTGAGGNDGSTGPVTGMILGGTVTGLAGKGLVLSDGASDAQMVTLDENGAFSFATPIAFGQMYNVTVAAMPAVPTQACAILLGTGTASATSTASLTVSCTTSSFAVGGTVTGLIGAVTGDAGGLDAGDAGDAGDGDSDGGAPDDAVIVQNGSEQVVVRANGAFAFPTKVASDGTYDVSIARQPLYPAQTCRVTGAAATVVAGDVTTVMVNCTANEYTIGGSVAGLTGTLVLQDGNGNSATVTASMGSYAFAPALSSQPYDVTVKTQPVGQLCSVADPAGTVGEQDVQNVNITCVPTYRIGGTLTGLTAGSVVLQDNGADDLTLTTAMNNQTFTFVTGVTGMYDVKVKTQPATEFCTVVNGKNTATSAVHNITVNCQ